MSYFSEFQFKHLDVYESFVLYCTLMVKVSKTKAVAVDTGDIYTVKKDTSVCKLSSLQYKSFDQGGGKFTWKKSVVEKYKKVKVDKC